MFYSYILRIRQLLVGDEILTGSRDDEPTGERTIGTAFEDIYNNILTNFK